MAYVSPEKKKKLDEARSAALDVIVKMMEEKGLNWTKEWNSVSYLPFNGVSGKSYNGVNPFHLMASAYAQGFSDPRWFTFRQAMKIGYPVKSGEHATPIEYWQPHHQYRLDPEHEWVDYKNREEVPAGAQTRSWLSFEKTHYMFNAEQLANAQGDPLPALEIPVEEVTLDERLCGIADKLEETSRCAIDESKLNDRACYNPKLDLIKVPDRRDFRDMESFVSTLTHEMAHSTMLPLEREKAKGNRYGSKNYAFEELVAELGSTFTCLELGVHRAAELETDENFENHAAYLQSWLKSFKSDPEYLFDAVQLADDAADYILDRYNPGWKKELEETRRRAIEKTANAHLSKLFFHPNQLKPIQGKEASYALTAEAGRSMRAAYSAENATWSVECRGFGGSPTPICSYGDTFEEAYLAAYRTLELKGLVSGISVGDPDSGKSCPVGSIAWPKVKIAEPAALSEERIQAIPLYSAQQTRQPAVRR